MNVKRIWTLGIGSVVGIFLFVACGASATSTLVPTPVPTPAPAATAAPGSGQTGVATPSPAASLGDAESTQASAETANGYVWQVSTVDDNGAKPSLAVDADGVPHIAYLLEDMPGFVKHAVIQGDGWDISTVATGYFYGPLDIEVDRDMVRLTFPGTTTTKKMRPTPSSPTASGWSTMSIIRVTTGGTTTWPWTPRVCPTLYPSIRPSSGATPVSSTPASTASPGRWKRSAAAPHPMSSAPASRWTPRTGPTWCGSTPATSP